MDSGEEAFVIRLLAHGGRHLEYFLNGYRERFKHNPGQGVIALLQIDGSGIITGYAKLTRGMYERRVRELAGE